VFIYSRFDRSLVLRINYFIRIGCFTERENIQRVRYVIARYWNKVADPSDTVCILKLKSASAAAAAAWISVLIYNVECLYVCE